MSAAEAPLAQDLLLIDSLHVSSFSHASTGAVMAALAVVERTMHNIVSHPGEERYRQLRLSSAQWQERVLPVFYGLRLCEWMRLLHNSDGTHLVFVEGNADGEHGGSTAVEREGEADMDLVEVLLCRLAELRLMRECWPTLPSPEVAASLCATSSSSARRQDTASASLPHFAFKEHVDTSATTADTASREARLLALVRQLSDAHPLLDDWTMVKRGLRARLLLGHARDKSIPSSLQWQLYKASVIAAQNPSHEADEEMVVDSLPGAGPVPVSLSTVTLLALQGYFTTVEAERFERNQRVLLSSSGGGKNSHKTSIAEAVRTTLQRRFRQQESAASVTEQERKTGEAYRALSAEERLVGTRLVADVGSLMEQVATIEGTLTVMRRDRLEARRLLAQFQQDGNLEALYNLVDEWEAKVEDAKRVANKATVYL